MIMDLCSDVNTVIKTDDFDGIDIIFEKQVKLLKFNDTIRRNQVKRIKANEVGTRNSMLFLVILAESKSLILQIIKLLKAYRNFTNISNGKEVIDEF
jgi:hypothetical protein